MGNLLLPLALFLMFKYLKTNNPGWGILFCIILILYPVLHPLPAIVLGIMLATLWIFPTIRDFWTRFREKNFNPLNIIRKNVNRKVLMLFLVLAVWFVFWYSSFSLWGYTFSQMYQTINSEGGSSNAVVLHLRSTQHSTMGIMLLRSR